MLTRYFGRLMSVHIDATERGKRAGEEFARLVDLMAALRGPGGCPWDQKQTFDSIKPYTLEETYEVLDAIDERNWPGLCEELGDYVLQAVFYAEMAAAHQHFSMVDSLKAINEKLVRRHPHVFADAVAKTPEEVKRRWDQIKENEAAQKGKAAPSSVLSGVPRTLPALMEAEKVSKKAADTGFDWPSTAGVLDKLQEEAEELAEAQATADFAAMEHEVGDLLFTLVNLARKLKIDPEQALRKTTGRFRQRFAVVERGVAELESEATLDQMEELWRQAKTLESRR